jgi:hypothetical protein
MAHAALSSNRVGVPVVLFVASACMGIVELGPHLYRLNLGRYQAYLWRDDDSITLIDTGEVGSAPAIAEALGQVELAPGDFDRLVLTHFHDDHVGSAAEVSSWGVVQVVAHVMDAPAIRGAMAGPAPKFTEFERELHAQVAAGLQSAPPVRIDLEVRDGDVLDFGGGAQVVSAPGHTDGQHRAVPFAARRRRHRRYCRGVRRRGDSRSVQSRPGAGSRVVSPDSRSRGGHSVLRAWRTGSWWGWRPLTAGRGRAERWVSRHSLVGAVA